jgi:hypothetical protein
MSATVLSSVFASGGRTARYGDYTVVYMQGSAFITTPMEFIQMQNWARARQTCGNAVRDRTLFVDRFETLLARIGCGLTSKGNRTLLSRIVKSMKANAMFLEEWSIPRNLDEGVEMKKKPDVRAAMAGGMHAPVPADATASSPAAKTAVR